MQDSIPKRHTTKNLFNNISGLNFNINEYLDKIEQKMNLLSNQDLKRRNSFNPDT